MLVEPTARPFPDAATTAPIACFEIGARPQSVRLNRGAALDWLAESDERGRLLRREWLESANRWGPLTREERKRPAGFVELDERCRVHGGAATGANRVRIAREHTAGLPDVVQVAAVTKARERFGAGRARHPAKSLRR
jgi:adenine-specific DNA-methyltransferase